MRNKLRLRAVAVLLLAVGALTQPATAGAQDVSSANMALLKNLPSVDDAAQSDLAFQGTYAYAGTFSGLRVIDISKPAKARQVAFGLIKSVATDCWSHTHTLVPAGKRTLYIYVSSFGLTVSAIGPNCHQFHGKISVIKVT